VRWSAETKNETYNVIDYGARGDGKVDDSKVFFFFFNELLFFSFCLNLLWFILHEKFQFYLIISVQYLCFGLM